MSSLMQAEERLNNALVRLESLISKKGTAVPSSNASDEILASLRKENAKLRDTQAQAKRRLDKLILNLESQENNED